MNCKIGDKIKALRQQQRMTQQNLADRLGVSFQSVSRWENGITYPDIELLPSIARLFSVSVDYLLGDDDGEKIKSIKRRIHEIGGMNDKDEGKVIELIKECRREPHAIDYFCRICYSLLYSPLHKNKAVVDELRKSKDIFFETCTDVSFRTEGLLQFSKLENDENIKAFLESNTTETPMSMDFLLKERYLFRDEFDKYEATRQRYFYKYIANLIDGDHALWQNASMDMNAEYYLFTYKTMLEFLNNLCVMKPSADHPVTCNTSPDIFAEQRIFIGLRYACSLFAVGKTDDGYLMLEDTVSLIEKIMEMNNEKLISTSPALSDLSVMVTEENFGSKSGRVKGFNIVLEDGSTDFYESIFINSLIECLESAEYARWGWLNPVRNEERFIILIDRLKNHA